MHDLIKFYPSVPFTSGRDESTRSDGVFYVGDLLLLCKTLVRNYSIAITETATPIVRIILTDHLLKAIKGHERILYYMYNKG